MKPIFLFSLPRSGSTLIQRQLGAHEEIATVSEPWILLPYLYTIKKEGTYAEYGYSILTQAIEDFCAELPNGQEDYLAEIHSLTLNLYAKAANKDVKYFLDKTPRYALIVDDIIPLFPEGKFIFLWRNPLSVASSIMETWGNGKWNLYRFQIDLFTGLANLISAYEKYGQKVYSLQYEAFLANPQAELKSLLDYLELPFNLDLLSKFTETKLQGLYGDPTRNKYQSINQEPLAKWQKTLANPVRKAWCRYYLNWIGQERLALMGYSLDKLLMEIDQIPLSFSKIGSDILRITYGNIFNFIKLQVLKNLDK